MKIFKENKGIMISDRLQDLLAACFTSLLQKENMQGEAMRYV